MTTEIAKVAPGATNIGFVGLGVMGMPMAQNLLKAGYTVRAHNRSRGKVDELAASGAIPTGSPREAADGADVVILMLPDSPDVEQVVRGESGASEGMRPGSVLIDMSTISPLTARGITAELGERDIAVLDAPVSGGQQGAIDGKLTIMVGGEESVFEACRPIFDVLGASVTLIGDAGSGQVAKACNQVLVAGTIQLVSEALTLAARSGVDPAKVRQAVLGGFAGSRVLEVHGQRILDRTFQPGFRCVLHHKDLGIALDTGSAAGVPLPATSLVRELLASILAQGGGDADHSSLALLAEELAGMTPDAFAEFRRSQ